MAILGPSGSGKSTLLRAICGLLPISGKVILNGTDVSNMKPHLRRMAMMFQDYALFPTMSTFKNISFPLEIRKISGDVVKRLVHRRAHEINGGLEESLKNMPNTLPEGLKQATAFARETVRDFDILMLDEPFSRLDTYQKQFVRADLKKRLRGLGKTYMLVVSDATDALSMADRIAILENGKICQYEEAMEVYRHPKNVEVAKIMSPLGLNVVKCREFNVSEGFVLAFRPDAVYETQDGIEFTIESVEPLNSRQGLFHLEKNECRIIALLSHVFSRHAGEKVKVALRSEDTWKFEEENI